MKYRTTTMAAAQASYDAMEPPECADPYEGPTYYACDCGEEWSSDDHDGVCLVCETDYAVSDVTERVLAKKRGDY